MIDREDFLKRLNSAPNDDYPRLLIEVLFGIHEDINEIKHRLKKK